MPYVWEILNQISSSLEPVTENPRFEAELLLAYSLGITRSKLLSNLKDFITPSDKLYELISQRLDEKPLAYILGFTEFYSLKIFTEPPVFIPRPETELLVEKTLEIIEKIPNRELKILEPCTGSGCISIAISKNAKKEVSIIATDISEIAIELARKNTIFHSVNISFILSDLFSAFAPQHLFDIIVCNPPYVAYDEWLALSNSIKKYEDRDALIGGDNGLKVIKNIVTDARLYLVSGGFLIFEIGENQKKNVVKLLNDAQYEDIKVYNDLQNLPRIVVCRWKK